jgi:hypothetical protein
MPYNPLSDGAALTAAHLLAEVYNQVVSQVTSATRPGSPAEGQVIYETDTNRLYVYNGSSWIQYGALGAGATWSPTLTQGGATGYAGSGRYTRTGNYVDAWLTINPNSGSPAANNAITLSLPVTAAVGSFLDIGQGHLGDASGSLNYPFFVALASSTTIQLIDTTAPTIVLLGQTGASFAAALAIGDTIVLSCRYEAA